VLTQSVKKRGARIERQPMLGSVDAQHEIELSGDCSSALGVGRRYGRRRPWALREVNVEFARGTITALVGPNGAGKSTLIRAWMGFERPNFGVSTIDPPKEHRHITQDGLPN
jgi:ABC-type bacteriocin/lantibiotic exporter with double-glycine peptidase domain